MAGMRTVRAKRVLAGGQSNANTPFSPLIGPRWIDLAMDGTGHPAISIATNGDSFTDLLTHVDADFAPHCAAGRSELLVILNGGQDDDYTELDTGAQIYADICAYADAIRAACTARGVTATVACMTLTPNYLSPPGDTNREAANALIVADASNKLDHVIDLVVPPLDDYEDTAIYSDGLHFTHDGGNPAVAALARPVIDLFLAP